MKTPILNIKFFLALTGLLSFAVIYQNCSGGFANSSNSLESNGQFSASGNGEGYTGKLSFVNFDVDGECGDIGAIRSAIDVIEGIPYLVKDNCRDIDAIKLGPDKVIAEPHNPHNLIFSDRIFDISTAEVPSSLLCKGEAADPHDGLINKADVAIKAKTSNGQTIYMGRVLVGVYTLQGELLRTYDSEDIPVKATTINNTAYQYLGRNQQNSEGFSLLHDPNGVSVLSYYVTNTENGSLELVDHRGLRDLRCYYQ